MVKGMLKSSPRGGDPGILPGKISFHGRVRRDVLFAEKVVLCYRCKTRHMLGENCPVATPTSEDSSMSLTEQSTAERSAPVQPESPIVTQHSTESQQTSSPIHERAEEGGSSAEDGSGSGLDSGSSSKQCDESEPAFEPGVGPGAPLESSPNLPSREDLSAVRGAWDNQGQDSQKWRAESPLKENQTQTVKLQKRSLKQLMILYKKAAKMPRGPKKHPKRHSAPTRWKLDRRRNRAFYTRRPIRPKELGVLSERYQSFYGNTPKIERPTTDVFNSFISLGKRSLALYP